MKKFNQEIQITISVDAIANQLRSMFKDDSANADCVVEQIIGRAMSKDQNMLGKIMSAMNGFQKEVFVKPGEKHTIKPFSVYGFWTEKSKEDNNSCYGNITNVTIVDVNPYADEEVCVQFEYPSNKNGDIKTQTKWISASHFSL